MRPIYNWVFNREGRENASESFRRRRTYSSHSKQKANCATSQDLEGVIPRSEPTSNDPWVLSERTKDSSGGASIPIELGSMHVEE